MIVFEANICLKVEFQILYALYMLYAIMHYTFISPGRHMRGLGLYLHHCDLLLPLQRHQVHGVRDRDQNRRGRVNFVGELLELLTLPNFILFINFKSF